MLIFLIIKKINRMLLSDAGEHVKGAAKVGSVGNRKPFPAKQSYTSSLLFPLPPRESSSSPLREPLNYRCTATPASLRNPANGTILFNRGFLRDAAKEAALSSWMIVPTDSGEAGASVLHRLERDTYVRAAGRVAVSRR